MNLIPNNEDKACLIPCNSHAVNTGQCACSNAIMNSDILNQFNLNDTNENISVDIASEPEQKVVMSFSVYDHPAEKQCTCWRCSKAAGKEYDPVEELKAAVYSKIYKVFFDQRQDKWITERMHNRKYETDEYTLIILLGKIASEIAMLGKDVNRIMETGDKLKNL